MPSSEENFPRRKAPPTDSSHGQKRDRRRCSSRGTQNTYFSFSPLNYRAMSQWARSLEWRHAVTLHSAVRKNCITFFPFYCEACSLYFIIMTLWLTFVGLSTDLQSTVYFAHAICFIIWFIDNEIIIILHFLINFLALIHIIKAIGTTWSNSVDRKSLYIVSSSYLCFDWNILHNRIVIFQNSFMR